MATSHRKHWKTRLYEIIFESDTKAGKAFDVALLLSIFASIAIVMADSVTAWHKKYGAVFLHAGMDLYRFICAGVCVAPGKCEKAF